MLILDNIIFSLQKAGGISIVWENLIHGIDGKIPVKFIEYNHSEKNLHRQALEIKEELIYNRSSQSLMLEQFRTPQISIREPFVFHSSYYRFTNHKLATNVTTVHDFIYEMTQKHLSFSQKIRCALTHRAIKNSDYLICISENTKKDLLKLVPDARNKPILVIYNGVSNDYHPSSIMDDKMNNYLLFVGGRQGYKNFDYAVEMAANSNRKLLVCGNELTNNELGLLNSVLGYTNYKFVLRPSNNELNRYYNSVEALIYPSSYEGFGIPVLEAQRAGCPVIALNASSIPEIIGDTPLLLSDLNSRSFKKALNILSQNNAKAEIIEAGLKNSQRFSWEKMSSEYLELYKRIMK